MSLRSRLLRNIHKPLGLASYTLLHTLPDNLLNQLPSIEALEQELSQAPIADKHFNAAHAQDMGEGAGMMASERQRLRNLTADLCLLDTGTGKALSALV